MKNRNTITSAGVGKERQTRQITQDYDRGIKRQVGRIRQVNSRGNGKLFVLADVPNKRGGVRPFGQDKTPILIADSPIDILARWGGVFPGQIIEIFYRGIGESGQAAAHIIGDETEDFTDERNIPEEGFDVAASLPFEPMGII